MLAIDGADRISSLGTGGKIVLTQGTTRTFEGAGIHHAIDGNIFFRGDETPNRSPCPAINLLANHGFTASVGESGAVFGDDNFALVDFDLDMVYESIVQYRFAADGDHAILGAAIESSGEAISYSDGVAALAVPEPSSSVLLSLSLGALCLVRRTGLVRT